MTLICHASESPVGKGFSRGARQSRASFACRGGVAIAGALPGCHQGTEGPCR
jgi:hypothetical protein